MGDIVKIERPEPAIRECPDCEEGRFFVYDDDSMICINCGARMHRADYIEADP